MSDALIRYDPAAAPPPFGLANTGAICHFNALLQALAGCTAVLAAAENHAEYLGRTATGRALRVFLAAAARGDPPPHASADVLRALCADLRARMPATRFGPNQESASEGLVLLLAMTDAAGGNAPPPENPLARLFYHRYEIVTECGACGFRAGRQLDNAIQFNLFGDADHATPAGLGERLLGRVERVADYACERCKKRGPCTRESLLRMVPEVVVCCYNIYGARKPRRFPDALELPGAEGPLRFRQAAQVEHFGGLHGGHYVARGLRRGGKVFLFNDSNVHPAAFAPTPDTYLVFYHHG